MGKGFFDFFKGFGKLTMDKASKIDNSFASNNDHKRSLYKNFYGHPEGTTNTSGNTTNYMSFTGNPEGYATNQDNITTFKSFTGEVEGYLEGDSNRKMYKTFSSYWPF